MNILSLIYLIIFIMSLFIFSIGFKKSFYHHFQNPIEKFFNQLKYYIRKDEPMSYDLIKKSIKNSIKNITIENYKNYFKSSLRKTKEDIEKIKSKYNKKPKIYKK